MFGWFCFIVHQLELELQAVQLFKPFYNVLMTKSKFRRQFLNFSCDVFEPDCQPMPGGLQCFKGRGTGCSLRVDSG